MNELEPQRALANARDISQCKAFREILWLLPSSDLSKTLPDPAVAQLEW